MKTAGMFISMLVKKSLHILSIVSLALVFGLSCGQANRNDAQAGTGGTLANAGQGQGSLATDDSQDALSDSTSTSIDATTQTTANPELVERSIPELLTDSQAAFARKNYSLARPLLEEILLREPNNDKASFMLASILFEQGTGSNTRILSLLDVAEAPVGKIPEAQWIRASIALSLKNFTVALPIYQYLLGEAGFKDRVFNKVLPVLESNSRWRELLSLTQNNLEQTKANARLFQYRANAYTQLGQGNQAVEALRIAARLDETNNQVKTLLAQAFISVQNYNEGVRTLETLVTQVPTTANYEKLAFCLDQLGRRDESYNAYIAASENNPLQTKVQIDKQLQLLITVSRNRLSAGNRHLAMLHYQQALSFNVKNEDLDKLGVQLFGANPPSAR